MQVYCSDWCSTMPCNHTTLLWDLSFSILQIAVVYFFTLSLWQSSFFFPSADLCISRKLKQRDTSTYPPPILTFVLTCSFFLLFTMGKWPNSYLSSNHTLDTTLFTYYILSHTYINFFYSELFLWVNKHVVILSILNNITHFSFHPHSCLHSKQNFSKRCLHLSPHPNLSSTYSLQED
jgi:hypothetical protein